jgi:hypothetical protein
VDQQNGPKVGRVLRLSGVVFLVGAAAIASPLYAQVGFFNPNLYLSVDLKKLSKPKCSLHAESFLVCSPFDQILYACTNTVVGSSSNCYFETKCVPSGQCGSRWVPDRGSIGRAGEAGSGMPIH